MAAERTELSADAREGLAEAEAALWAADAQLGRLRFKLTGYDARERDAAAENVSFAIKKVKAALEAIDKGKGGDDA